ncbi:hypothetical protein LJR220_003446 [Bradyrhizobium sp. LjRoot220]|uniref:hypothetical protein n=1 Tax=Bradyrhizobium sp. LjRoot220 TaxID=3342284 RepID=UPI003ECF4251
MSDQELFTEDEIETIHSIRTFSARTALVMQQVLQIPSDLIFITFERAFAKGPVDKPLIQYLNTHALIGKKHIASGAARSRSRERKRYKYLGWRQE